MTKNKNDKIPSQGDFIEIAKVASAKTAEVREFLDNYREELSSLHAPDVGSWAICKFDESLTEALLNLTYAMIELERAGVFARGSVGLENSRAWFAS